ncbi:MAG: polymer-forming cytoskeletal protein [Myxococcales bacterium]|nr:polymer-forming cytoskeletal protein [Myxococcales bacterium]MDD9964622.1 polymer-forming cytoskeletal protein [Myxococcales bacterium]
MFGNSSNNSRGRDAEPTVIGAGAVIEGTIKVEGRVQLDGRVEGTLDVDGEVSVGPKGCVIGELIGTQVAIGGTAEGKVTVREHLHIVASGRVRGDVRYESLQVDRGGVLDGTTAHGEEEYGFSPVSPDQPAKVPSVPPPPAH